MASSCLVFLLSILSREGSRESFVQATGWSPTNNQDFIDIRYWQVYPFNQDYPCPMPCCCCYVGGAHQGDIEGVTVRLNARDHGVRAVYFGAHGYDDGTWQFVGGSGPNQGNSSTCCSTCRGCCNCCCIVIVVVLKPKVPMLDMGRQSRSPLMAGTVCVLQ